MRTPKPFTFTDAQVATLQKSLVFVRPNQNIIHDEILLEPPFMINGAFWSYAPLRIGAFSYTFSSLTSNIAEIGRYCSIAADVRFGEAEHPLNRLSTSSFTYDPEFVWRRFLAGRNSGFRPQPLPIEKKRQPIRVGNDVWIGARAYLRAGVVVGDAAVIGANAVVTKDVPPYAIVAGNPARILRLRFAEATIERLRGGAWWRFSFSDLGGIDLADVDRALDEIERREASGDLVAYAPDQIRLDAIVEDPA